jgi:uncharacterized protein (TIGR02145 family)
MNFLKKIKVTFICFLLFAFLTQKIFAQNDVIYFDDFTSDKGLKAANDGCSKGVYNYKYYQLSSTANYAGVLPLNKYIDQSKDFQIEVTMKFVSGQDNNANGIKWGKSNNSSFYNFAFSGDGHFSIGKRVNNQWVDILAWTKSSYVNSSNYNKLTIRKISSMYYFFINENLVHECYFETFYGDDNCLFSNSNSTVHISTINITYFKGNLKKNESENLSAISTTYNPSFITKQNKNVILDKVEINSKYTVVTMTYTTESDNGQFWFDKGAYIKANQRFYYLQKSDLGFSQYECNLLKNKGESKTFKLYFNRIEEGIENIDILELQSEGAFNFLGVKINNKAKSSDNSSLYNAQNNTESKNSSLKLSQSWIKQNAKLISDVDGFDLNLAEDLTQWKSLCDKDQPAYCYYKFDSENENMGLIYNHAAVRVIAPEGYRVPSKKDFEILLQDLKNIRPNSTLCSIVNKEDCSICFNCNNYDYDKSVNFNLSPYGWLSVTRSNKVKWKANTEDIYFWTLENNRNNSKLSGLGIAQFKLPSGIITVKLEEINNTGSKSSKIELDDFEYVEKYFGTYIRFIKN